VRLRETEARNQELDAELENTKVLLQENMDEINRLQEIIEQRGHDSSMNGESRSDLRRQVEEAWVVKGELDAKLEERLKLLALREDEKEELLDLQLIR
jgi:hypothetical protein